MAEASEGEDKWTKAGRDFKESVEAVTEATKDSSTRAWVKTKEESQEAWEKTK